MTFPTIDLRPNLERLRVARKEARDAASSAVKGGSAAPTVGGPSNLQIDPQLGQHVTHRFPVGHMVQFTGRQSLTSQAPGLYEILAQIPERDGEPQYRIKSAGEPHQRVVREGLLVE